MIKISIISTYRNSIPGPSTFCPAVGLGFQAKFLQRNFYNFWHFSASWGNNWEEHSLNPPQTSRQNCTEGFKAASIMPRGVNFSTTGEEKNPNTNVWDAFRQRVAGCLYYYYLWLCYYYLQSIIIIIYCLLLILVVTEKTLTTCVHSKEEEKSVKVCFLVNKYLEFENYIFLS